MTKYIYFLLLLFAILLFVKCGNKDENPTIIDDVEYYLTSDLKDLEFNEEGGSKSINVESNTLWKIDYDNVEWVKPLITSGKNNATVKIVADANFTTQKRSAVFNLYSENVEKIEINISQLGREKEEEEDDEKEDDTDNEKYIDPDMTGVEKNAIELAYQMQLGWNLGNTLEVPGNETGWGNPKTTKEIIDMVKNAGFDAVRIPCAWDSYIEDRGTAKIKDSWMNRVKEVVGYCLDND
ncbi:MAG: cellulase family glycosylhydrolase, partial [Bacteroidales bacterium]|nr:cellulase family glycosylhydrolase [Bacteroidales bacterium]